MKTKSSDWRQPTTVAQRLGDAVQLLCSGKRPPEAVVLGWLDHSSEELQNFCAEHGPSWAQGIGLIDAAELLADQPTEILTPDSDCDHERRKPLQGAAAALRESRRIAESGQRVAALKHYQKVTGCSLEEARDAIFPHEVKGSDPVPSAEACAQIAERVGRELMSAGKLQAGVVAKNIAAAIRKAFGPLVLGAGAASPDLSTPGEWFVRYNADRTDCFVAAPDCKGYAYGAEILGDDEYTTTNAEYDRGDPDAGIKRKIADCELIVAAVKAYRAGRP